MLSNTNQTLGVFSTLFAAQKYYSTLYRDNTPLFHVKLEEFTLNGISGKDMSSFLKEGYSSVTNSSPYGKAQVRRQGAFNDAEAVIGRQGTKIVLGPPTSQVLQIRKPVQPKILESRQFGFMDVYECDYCGGEDCRDGCVNYNYDL